MPITNPSWVPPIEFTFDEGNPITSKQGLMLAGNPIAIANGGAGAPRVHAEAMQGSVAGDTVLFGTGGTGVVFETSEGIITETIPDATFRATTNCEVRVKAEFAATNGSAPNVAFKVFKNGTAVQTDIHGNTAYVTSTPVDITLEAGDIVQVGGTGSDGAGGLSGVKIRNITYSTGAQRSVGGI